MLPAILAGCAAPPVVSLDDLPGWNEDRLAELVRAPSEAAARDELRRRYRPQPLPRFLFTGYFEITVIGARSQGGRFQTPVLRPPPHREEFDRAQILGGALAGRGLELAWLAGPADLFFLQLQGSGRIVLAEGGVMRVVSAGSNGRAPVATARLFGGAGLPNNDLSIPAMRAWIAVHPDSGLRRLALDPSYVFFRENAGGASGVRGRQLVPLRSMAVDPAVIPLGALVWIDVAPDRGPRLRRLMFADDTGPPIRGAHADIFFGAGAQAEEIGGHLNAEGRAWLLNPGLAV